MTLKVIEGGAEGGEMVKPRLVKNNETGQICMQVALGQYEATLPLPDHLAGATPERLQQFFDAVVPEMTEHLREMAKKDRRKFRAKARKA
jgi:hypothetical protein